LIGSRPAHSRSLLGGWWLLSASKLQLPRLPAGKERSDRVSAQPVKRDARWLLLNIYRTTSNKPGTELKPAFVSPMIV
jgi:hypothetical protein